MRFLESSRLLGSNRGVQGCGARWEQGFCLYPGFSLKGWRGSTQTLLRNSAPMLQLPPRCGVKLESLLLHKTVGFVSLGDPALHLCPCRAVYPTFPLTRSPQCQSEVCFSSASTVLSKNQIS